MNRAWPRLLFVALTLASGCMASGNEAPGAEGVVEAAVTLTQVDSFGSNPGALRMFKYVPADLPTGAPLVVALHGCTESASVYSTQTEWGTLADRFGFSVVFAEQPSSNNVISCFNWFQTSDISRDQGEALSIKQMVDKMKSDHGSDPARVFVTGMSAGGYMTTVMMATYPDVFAGGSVNAGGAYACATAMSEASPCQNGQVDHTPQQWGTLVRDAFRGYTGPYPRLIAFQGSTDTTVKPANLQQQVDQWSNVLGIDGTPEVNETFRTATHEVFRDDAGRSMIETYLVSSEGHALNVDPGTASDQGGTTGAFSEDHNIYASFYAAEFFGLTGDGGGGGGSDTTAPTVSITSPASGATVSGALAVTATASDDVGVTRVDVLVDGVVVGSDASAPYAVSVDTTALDNGPHAVTAHAVDAASNTGTSTSVAIDVQNDDGGGGGGGGTALSETFSSDAGPDNAGWTFGGWTLAAADATGTTGSRSLAATASPRFNTVTQTATWSGLAIGAGATLSYSRTLALSDANITASASFQVIITDGTDHVVDSQSVSGFASYSEPSFVNRASIDLSAFAGRTVTLKLVVSAKDLASTVSKASASIDQIQIQ